jgi:uncharacterized membrane protein YeaQ/YmgE (transglycosylase-associated protein family)
MWYYIGQFIVGFVVGVIAKFLTGEREKMGIILTGILGMVGVLLGTLIGQKLGWYQAGETAGWIVSIIGAVVVVLIYHFVRKKM